MLLWGVKLKNLKGLWGVGFKMPAQCCKTVGPPSQVINDQSLSSIFITVNDEGPILAKSAMVFPTTFHFPDKVLVDNQNKSIDPFQLVGMQLNWRTEQWVALCMRIDFIAAWRFSFVLSSSSEVLTSHLKGVYRQ